MAVEADFSLYQRSFMPNRFVVLLGMFHMATVSVTAQPQKGITLYAPDGFHGLDAAQAQPAARLITSGVRTSPHTLPKEDDHTFVTDDAPTLDRGCTYSSLGPIEFDIKITRHIGELNADGTLRDADALVQAGLLSDKVTLQIPAFDVDYNAIPPRPYRPERDLVLFNGEEVGYLTGEDNTWKLNTFQIDIRKVKFAARAPVGSSPQGAANRVTIQIDVANYPTQVWCTSADWGAASFKAMSPVILIHGHGSDGGFFARQGFTAALESRHILFDNSISNPMTTVEENALNLDREIPGIVKSFGVDSVHFIAHSKGGLDSRGYLAMYQPGHDRDFKVLSYNTLSTPHNGSLLADLLLQRDEAARQAVIIRFSGLSVFTQILLGTIRTDTGEPNLTTWFTASFNRNLSLIPGSTVFNTVAADADTDNDGVIDIDPDEYRELRDESLPLRNLHDRSQTASRIAVDIPYQILRNDQRIDLRFEREEFWENGPEYTTAMVTLVAAPEPVGNDTLVTIPSGHGKGVVASRVRNRHTYHGRNHSSVANGGVALAVIPWLIDIEKKNGDLR